MDFNPKEIQKFYDIWSPMLEALPAVIAAAERGDELKRHTAILTKELQDVQKKIADEEARVAPVKASVEQKLAELAAMKDEAVRGYNQYVADAKAHIAEVDKQTDEEVAKIKAKVIAANSQLQDVEKKAAEAKALADMEIAAAKKAAEAELADIEAKKQTVEKALASLKAKIG